jgi:WD40 repeat protein
MHVSTDREVVLLGDAVTVHDPSGAVLATLAVDARHVRTSRDARIIAAQRADDTIEIFDRERTPPSVATIPAATQDAFALSADGTRLFTGNSDGTVRVFEASSGRQLEVRQIHRRRVQRISLSADEAVLLADVSDYLQSHWDFTADTTATLLDIAPDHHSLAELTQLVEHGAAR